MTNTSIRATLDRLELYFGLSKIEIIQLEGDFQNQKFINYNDLNGLYTKRLNEKKL